MVAASEPPGTVVWTPHVSLRRASAPTASWKSGLERIFAAVLADLLNRRLFHPTDGTAEPFENAADVVDFVMAAGVVPVVPVVPVVLV
jgi:hypothetical protein